MNRTQQEPGKVFCIEVDFTIPDDYSRRFIFQEAGFRHEIWVESPNQVCSRMIGEPNENNSLSRGLDFVEESIMTIRAECGAEL